MPGRKANGEGTLYKRKDGRYEAALYVTTTSDTRKRVRVYGKTRTEVHAKLIEAKAQDQHGIPTVEKSWRIGEYLDYWLTEVVRPNRRPSTYAQCETVVRLYLKPGIGGLLLKRLSVPILQTYLNRQIDEGHSVPKTYIMRKVLSSALTRAEQEELVPRNVARLVQLPPHESPEVIPWSPDEAVQFLTVAKPHMWYAAYLLLLVYGLRRGEVLGLRWQDVDFARDELRVRQQLLRVGTEVLQGPVKTRAGRRDLPLVELARHALQQQYARRLVRTEPDHDLVFTTSLGTPIEPGNFVRAYLGICRRGHLRSVKMHALRHTAATMLKNLNVPARDAQLILGHSHVSITQQIYQHGDMASRREAVNRLEMALNQMEPKTSQTEGNGRFESVADGSRCRQSSRQSNIFIYRLRAFISGATTGIRTQDLILTMSKNDSIIGRSTELHHLLRTRSRQWILGCAAVSAAVNVAIVPADDGR
ncbi:tyrosine-type recombinase/integrase [Amycolatopsis sp. H20-H5]|uniref:tyrosine-type recombinase/integrase n=1 Tax=Amycolatopsis sp. H20-H5 TaxID=3046309 RepID=UPI002DBC5F1E|nr:tyrosine-type recombinase/integrase [Amycolatopsis sp. H20-H5]MEC3979528.1 tyrosine-type recombinase/integrase [Amycolatopsis sp. H20-H5]